MISRTTSMLIRQFGIYKKVPHDPKLYGQWRMTEAERNELQKMTIKEAESKIKRAWLEDVRKKEQIKLARQYINNCYLNEFYPSNTSDEKWLEVYERFVKPLEEDVCQTKPKP